MKYLGLTSLSSKHNYSLLPLVKSCTPIGSSHGNCILFITRDASNTFHNTQGTADTKLTDGIIICILRVTDCSNGVGHLSKYPCVCICRLHLNKGKREMF